MIYKFYEITPGSSYIRMALTRYLYHTFLDSESDFKDNLSIVDNIL